MQPLLITDRSQNLTAFDPNYKNPYIQNFTLSVTRSLGAKLTADVRYVGTKATNIYTDIPLNTRNFLTNGLLEAFNAARTGGDSPLLTDMFMGLNIGGQVVNGTTWTGAQAMQASTQFQNNLANGNYNAVATTLNTLNVPIAAPTGVQGAVLRNSGKFPENFIVANPQLNNATFKANAGYSNYHSLQTQVTLRPTLGMSYQGTYTWSRGLALGGPQTSFTNPTDRAGDYTLQSSHRAHDFRSNGTFELPIGPGRPFLGNSSGFLARLVEQWQATGIFRMTSGAPISITAQSMLYNNGTPDVVGPFDPKAVKVEWEGETGTYLPAGMYTTVRDPQCATVETSIRSLCTLNAVALSSTGQIVLRHPQPGKRGTLGRNIMEGPGIWVFDLAMSKTIRIGESKSVVLRVDAQNVLNHPTPDNPNLSLTSNQPFGSITTKSLPPMGGGVFYDRAIETPPRAFQAQFRVNF